MKSFTIQKTEKLTKALLRLYNGALPYGTLMRLLKNKDVKVNGKRISKDVNLLVGDVVDVYYDGVENFVTPTLVFSSQGVFVFNKPAGITSEDFEKIVTLKHKLEKYIKMSKSKSRQFNYYVGYAPDVKAYLEGNPLSMLNKENPKRKHIDIYYNSAILGNGLP